MNKFIVNTECHLIMMLFFGILSTNCQGNDQNIGSAEISTKISEIRNGTEVPIGNLGAVGMVGFGCTGTLIAPRIVLTAAHCLCGSSKQGSQDCVARKDFRFSNVYPVDDPETLVNESLTRLDWTSISGSVVVYPGYGYTGWERNDYALILLDIPANKVIKEIQPIPVEQPQLKPELGDLLTIVGFATIDCNEKGFGIKRSGSVRLKQYAEEVFPSYKTPGAGTSMMFGEAQIGVCPGDSGGPSLNAKGKVVGVASTTTTGKDSNYDPTHEVFPWIEGYRMLLGGSI